MVCAELSACFYAGVVKFIWFERRNRSLNTRAITFNHLCFGLQFLMARYEVEGEIGLTAHCYHK